LGLQYGLRASNYPLAEDDFERDTLPEPVKAYKNKIFGLTISPQRLHQIRTQRKPNSRYASLEQCEYEVRRAELLFKRVGIQYFDTTSSSIEEIATNIVQSAGLRRRIG
jgi:regulator of PEP synthase PpsR (kinase-PPPase family)